MRDHERTRRPVMGIVVVAVGLFVAALPAPTQAEEFEDFGLNGAQLWLDNSEVNFPAPVPTRVAGKNFTENALAQLFLCPATATASPLTVEKAAAFHTKCLLVDARQTDAKGSFSTNLPVFGGNGSTFTSPVFVTADGTPVACREVGASQQCSVAAATYDPLTRVPTSAAAHLICWLNFPSYTPAGEPCEVPTIPTSTTLPPPPTVEWEDEAPLPSPREELAAASTQDNKRIYTFGGSNCGPPGVRVLSRPSVVSRPP